MNLTPASPLCVFASLREPLLRFPSTQEAVA